MSPIRDHGQHPRQPYGARHLLPDLPDLRALDPAQHASRATSPAAQALLERIIATPRAEEVSSGAAIYRRAAVSHRRRRRLALLALPLAGAAAAGLVFASTDRSGGGDLVMAAPSAADLATWQATAQPVTGASDARRACMAEFGSDIADDPAATWLLEERRGTLTSMIASYGDQTAYCLVAPDGTGLLNSMTSGIEEDLLDQPVTGLTQAVSGDDLDGPTDQRVHYVTGRYAPGVTDIELDLSDGRQVTASMQDGWYTAWWSGTALSSTARIAWDSRDGAYTQTAFSELAF